MRKDVVLITGANGEIGHGLIAHLGERKNISIVAMDVQPLDETLRPYCERFIQGDILDNMLLGRLVAEFEIRTIFHLASILSTKAEYNPETAHRVNVEGTLNLLRLAVEQSQWQVDLCNSFTQVQLQSMGYLILPPKPKSGKSKRVIAAAPSPCTAATSFIVKTWGNTTCTTTSSLRLIIHQCMSIFAAYGSPG